VLYRGIANRGFVRRFQLADYVEVAGANVADGLLTIDLVRQVPESMKPKHIPVQTAAASSAANESPQVEQKQAA
jgi:molecular chaperone IbpA